MVMLNVGEYIDGTLGVTFGLTTLVAAGFGQLASDTCGVCFGGTVEALALKLGLPSAGLSAEQLRMKETKFTTTFGMAVGVIIGCALGMCCLLFKDLDKAERLKREKEMDIIFETVIEAGGDQLGAERSTLFILDEETNELWSKFTAGGRLAQTLRLPMGRGIAGWVAQHGELVNIADAYKDERFSKAADAQTGFHTRNVLCAPVYACCGKGGLHKEGKIIAVVQAMNKKDSEAFGPDDETVIRAIAAHVAIFMRHMEQRNEIMLE
eukprot:CAMPEP_0114544804 /NCGR_PEP_ID=MMETSP0114-20121206/3068_1 /TAXON_ID=31324 /ORGANISM="Goniomonas sp, Strain m" /LENGTH=265 /DNA_ID=CAMNT_0001729201 /DNA_START=257 /DNA_END=1054 /DNA_ORIENTATION=+